MGKQDDFFRTQIRIPADLHRALKDAAEESGRSMNAEIVARLEISFDAETAFTDAASLSARLREQLKEVRSEIEMMEHSRREAEGLIKELRDIRKGSESR